MAVQYDPKIIAQHAEALYRRASRIVVSYGVMGFLVGAVVLGAVGAQGSGGGAMMSLVGGGVGALVGIGIGRGRAFVYRLQAQQALCQVAIEWNTRRDVVSSPRGAATDLSVLGS